MADLATKKLNFVARYRDKASLLLDTLSDLKEYRTEWDSQGYSSSIQDADLTNAVNHITAAQLASVVTSIQAITDLLAANSNAHYTNLYRIVR